MPIFTKDPEKEAAKLRDAEERARQQQEEAFKRSPVGQARASKEAGRRFFEVALPLSQTKRTAMAVFSGDKTTKTSRSTEHLGLLEAIEAEGWRLEHAGYVFQETGSVSRDKLLSSGQTASVEGEIVGIYLFRAV